MKGSLVVCRLINDKLHQVALSDFELTIVERFIEWCDLIEHPIKAVGEPLAHVKEETAFRK